MQYATIWAWFCSCYLVYLTWQDIRTMQIDERYTYLMIGMTVPLVYFTNQSWLYLVISIVMAFALTYYFRFFNVFGAGDLSTIFFSYIGYATFGFIAIAMYIGLFTLYLGIYNLTAKYVFKSNSEKLAGYPVLFSAYCSVALYLGLYL